jgi:hypothetical protein
MVELLAMIAILTVIVTVTGVLLRETRLTASRLAENEESAHTAARAMELIRHDIERSVADSRSTNFVFVSTDAVVDINSLPDTCINVGPGTNVPVVPIGANGARLCMVIFNDNQSNTSSNRALSEVFYWLASGPSSAYPSLVRAERLLYADDCPIYTDYNWYNDTNGLAPEIVARYVTDFSVRCSDRNFTVWRNWTSNELPVCVDVFIEYLPESSARRLNGRNALTNLVEIERNVTKTATRIFPPNRRGYMGGK